MDRSVATRAEPHNARRLTSDLPVVFILGATATGKSSLAIELARRFQGEIVSCDSRYFYRGMDIGTAKPSPDELRDVPHHLVDILNPEDDYSLAVYLDDAFAAIESIGGRGKLPIVAGGTPLYLRALLQGWTVPKAPPDLALRASLEEREAGDLYRMVLDVDPVSAERIGRHNKRRLIRAYEVHATTGERLSDLEGKQPPPYRMLVVGLRQDRDALYRRIDGRVAWMFEHGILDEARWLIERGVPEQAAAMSAIGYPEALAVVRGEMEVGDAIERTCTATHRYVRHQETWFRRFDDVAWLDVEDAGYVAAARSMVERLLEDQSVTG